MKIALRALLLLVIFVGVGLLTTHLVLAHAVQRYGTYMPETRLAAMMGGLFAGGAAAVIALITMLLLGARRSPGSTPRS